MKTSTSVSNSSVNFNTAVLKEVRRCTYTLSSVTDDVASMQRRVMYLKKSLQSVAVIADRAVRVMGEQNSSFTDPSHFTSMNLNRTPSYASSLSQSSSSSSTSSSAVAFSSSSSSLSLSSSSSPQSQSGPKNDVSIKKMNEVSSWTEGESYSSPMR